MSEALDRIRDLRRAGFGFLTHRDDGGEITALQAIRVRAGHIETVLIHGEHDALAARCRDEPRAAVVWHQAGPNRRRHHRTARPAHSRHPRRTHPRRRDTIRPLAPAVTPGAGGNRHGYSLASQAANVVAVAWRPVPHHVRSPASTVV